MKLSKAQEWILIVGALFLFVVTLFPPIIARIPTGLIKYGYWVERFDDFRFITAIVPDERPAKKTLRQYADEAISKAPETPAENKLDEYTSYSIAYGYLAFEWLSIMICTAVAVTICENRKRTHPSQ